MCKSISNGTGFEDMRGHGEQLATLRGQGRPLVEGVVLVAVEVPTSKGSWREVGGWHHVAGSESLKRAQQKLLAKAHPEFQGRPQHIRDPSAMGWPWTAAGMVWKPCELTRQATCATDDRAKGVELSVSPGAQSITSRSQMSNSECLTLLDFGFALMWL